MDAIRKQASKFREQVAKQQQAVLKQFAGYTGSQGPDIFADEVDLKRHQQLERLYISTRAGKHFQREIVRGIEGFISTGSKQLEVSSKLADDCCKYASEGPNATGALARASNVFGNSVLQIEKERETLHRALGTQVAEPLRAMVMGAPLEDARHLCQRYDRLRQEAEAQAAEVARRQVRSKEAANVENTYKLQQAETKLSELTSAMTTLGKEAAAAMIAVEAQQQRLTLQRLIAMVEAERVYHQRTTEVLNHLHIQMVAERQRSEVTPAIGGLPESYLPPPAYDDIKPNGPDSNMSNAGGTATQKSMFFFAEVIHAFEAEAPGELSLVPGDYVVVRQVSPTGWSEGESKGKCGWFPTSHVERRQRAPASKVVEASSLL
ncbi:hypothetical protein GOP47_0023099 [Adiantum capillus-veneris]|uniref:SH3 domain-containing protein n=1 Tax=Adiantum capillus-veneris TaxID=13818 RepID=A0A9D4Z665_ADICA|nr:hypothetical protein GOP47_0023099 [Adiantum capillus-veneris]